MKLIITLIRDKTGMILAECPSIPGCTSQGRTREEAVAKIREVLHSRLESHAEDGVPPKVEIDEIDFEWPGKPIDESRIVDKYNAHADRLERFRTALLKETTDF